MLAGVFVLAVCFTLGESSPPYLPMGLGGGFGPSFMPPPMPGFFGAPGPFPPLFGPPRGPFGFPGPVIKKKILFGGFPFPPPPPHLSPFPVKVVKVIKKVGGPFGPRLPPRPVPRRILSGRRRLRPMIRRRPRYLPPMFRPRFRAPRYRALRRGILPSYLRPQRRGYYGNYYDDDANEDRREALEDMREDRGERDFDDLSDLLEDRQEAINDRWDTRDDAFGDYREAQSEGFEDRLEAANELREELAENRLEMLEDRNEAIAERREEAAEAYEERQEAAAEAYEERQEAAAEAYEERQEAIAEALENRAEAISEAAEARAEARADAIEARAEAISEAAEARAEARADAIEARAERLSDRLEARAERIEAASEARADRLEAINKYQEKVAENRLEQLEETGRLPKGPGSLAAPLPGSVLSGGRGIIDLSGAGPRRGLDSLPGVLPGAPVVVPPAGLGGGISGQVIDPLGLQASRGSVHPKPLPDYLSSRRSMGKDSEKYLERLEELGKHGGSPRGGVSGRSSQFGKDSKYEKYEA